MKAYSQSTIEAVITGHDKLTTHLVELVPAHGRRAICFVGLNTSTNTEHLVGNVELVEKDLSCGTLDRSSKPTIHSAMLMSSPTMFVVTLPPVAK